MTIKDRLAKRRKQLLEWFDNLEKLDARGKLGGEPGRIWLDQFAVGPRGVNIACGDFPIGESQGVDFDPHKVAIDHWGFGDALPEGAGKLDYVVTNYLECFPNTRQALREWHRVLRVDGVLAIVCCNALAYPEPLGPFVNERRWHCFTPDILRWHLEKVGFQVFRLETEGRELRVAARRRA